MSTTMHATDGRRARGDASRREILRVAADLASVDGLDGLTIGRLAERSGRSKSSVATLFGSKESLQLATVDAAAAAFHEAVVEPAREHPAGVRRLAKLLQGVLDYSRERVFSGGCFFAATSADLDSKDGPAADAVRAWTERWFHYLENQARLAADSGELDLDDDAVELLGFELVSLTFAANMRSLLGAGERPYSLASAAIREHLRRAGADDDALSALA